MNKYEGFSVGAIVTVLLGCLALVWLAAGNYAAKHAPVPTKAAQTEPATNDATCVLSVHAKASKASEVRWGDPQFDVPIKPPKAAKRPKDSFPLEILQPGWSIICLNFDSKRRVIEPAYDNPDCQPGGKFHPSTEWKNSPFVIPPEGPNLICESYPCSLAPDDPGSHSGPKLPPWATSTLAPPESGILVPAPQVAPPTERAAPGTAADASAITCDKVTGLCQWKKDSVQPLPTPDADRIGSITALAPALREFPPFDPVDVPPVKVLLAPDDECKPPLPGGAKFTDGTIDCSPRYRDTCADKSRYLLTAEDGTRHCIRIGERP